MVITVLCTLLFLSGLVLIVVFGGRPMQSPVGDRPPPSGAPRRIDHQKSALLRYIWWASVTTFATLVSGILMAGAGGRLAMRVLALTSPQAQGRLTEAGETVGDITMSGTLGFFQFVGLIGGFLSALLFVLVHSWLPRGRLGGAVFGVLLLVVFGATLEPLRADNVDFTIVGPGWLSVVLFSVLMVLHGMLVAAAAGWYSGRLPARFSQSRLAYSPLAGLVLLPPAAVLVVIGALAVLVVSRFVPPTARWWTSRPVRWAGVAVIGMVVILSLPGFVGSLTEIVGRT
ncbi:hypothetical protein [Arthrobacter sp. Br18]|uniref:hypothetical protein n=1 Tax=Arthrobacter sp. Br18 TaxID=1312954 RepID=UPI0004B9FB76|nr:hypothetical protein [Arthrobacter sp. Br18]